MLSKKQKVWLYIFGAMFLIPEILFLNIISSILSFVNNFSGVGIIAPIYYLIDQQFFTDHTFFAFIELAIEWVGIIGLTIFSIKSRKIIFILLSSIILLFFSVIFFFAYVFSTMSLVL